MRFDMKVASWCFILLFFLIQPSRTQDYNLQVKAIIDQVNTDSLVSFVRILSGEDSLRLGGDSILIQHRTNNLDGGNGSTAEYLKQKLGNYGLQIVDQSYSEDGRNIIALQTGTDYADQIIIVCAHYDAVDYYCADDNASGVAAVIEASRILSGYTFKQTIAYAFWDQEEIGLIGSSYFAQQALQDSLDIRAVINLDMIGWDGNDDGLMEIHTSNVAGSLQLADLAFSIDSVYDLSLDCVITDPGTQASDHSSFWNQDYAAVLFIEAYFGDDFNPFYHSSEDRVDQFNLSYFTDISKLALGTITTLALANPALAAASLSSQKGEGLTVYPNPLIHHTNVQYELSVDQQVVLTLFNTLGIKVKDLVNDYQSAGKHTLTFQADLLSDGIYLLVLKTQTQNRTYKLSVHR